LETRALKGEAADKASSLADGKNTKGETQMKRIKQIIHVASGEIHAAPVRRRAGLLASTVFGARALCAVATENMLVYMNRIGGVLVVSSDAIGMKRGSFSPIFERPYLNDDNVRARPKARPKKVRK
jgi:hypothetical protein